MTTVCYIVLGVLVIICLVAFIVIGRNCRDLRDNARIVQDRAIMLTRLVDEEIKRTSSGTVSPNNFYHHIEDLRFIKEKIKTLQYVYEKNLAGYSLMGNELSELNSYLTCIIALDNYRHNTVDRNAAFMVTVSVIEQIVTKAKSNKSVENDSALLISVYNEAADIIASSKFSDTAEGARFLRTYSKSISVLGKLLHIGIYK